ncbi:MaoC family dehydratase [Haloglomus litoreum]|uniref:MaoC family dehydratase n=1 Tax=Haloglomus litoreum TaxID=3034026 RepID=UPI0023E8D354|nr:MaoC family dehydratase [Haloglomus sp. DT116]
MTASEERRPESMLYFEDLSVGDEFPFGPRTVTREEIVSFAEAYDPRPFHLDDAAVENSVFDGLVASGWHTAALCTRMQVDDVFDDIAAMGGRGVNDLRWPIPVRPGDTLSGMVTVADRRVSHHDHRGNVDFRTELLNQEDEPVLTMESLGIVRRRPTTDA